jgi:DNA-binding transcriptional ArsR family regulator
MNEFMNACKALSDQNRVRVLMALVKRELCVCQLIELLGLAPSTVSKHMSILKNAGLVECRKEGLWIHYRLPDKPSSHIKKAIEWICDSLKASDTIKKDDIRIRRILKMAPEDICRKQNTKACCKTKK